MLLLFAGSIIAMQQAVGEEPASWPHLVGKPVADAVAELKAAHPALKVLPVPSGSMVTMDYRLDRVRVFHDSGKVSAPPQRG